MEEWNVCRLCLQAQEDLMKSLPDITYNLIPFFNLYFELMGIEFRDYPAFPAKVCSSCESRMTEAYKFKEQCLETEDKLKELLSEKSEEAKEENRDDQNPEEPGENHHQAFDEKIDEEPPKDTTAGPPKKNVIKVTRKQMMELQTRLIQCSKCKELFKGIELFRKHICQEQHETDDDPEPPEGPEVNGIELLKGLDKEIVPKVPKPRKICEKCGKSFSSRTNYNSHMDKHNGFKRYPCTLCNRKFSHWTTKRTHIYRDHYNKFYCTCSECGQGFYSQSALQTHSPVHETTGVQCETCGKTFKLKRTLQSHMNTHTDKKECKECGKILKNAQTLKAHMQKHLNERNYSCPVCSNRFTCNHGLKSHVRNLHPDQVHLLPPDGTIVNEKYLKKLEERNREDDE